MRQFADYMQLLLLAAGVVSIIFGQISTVVLLIGVSLVNVVLGYLQEGIAVEMEPRNLNETRILI